MAAWRAALAAGARRSLRGSVSGLRAPGSQQRCPGLWAAGATLLAGGSLAAGYSGWCGRAAPGGFLTVLAQEINMWLVGYMDILVLLSIWSALMSGSGIGKYTRILIWEYFTIKLAEIPRHLEAKVLHPISSDCCAEISQVLTIQTVIPRPRTENEKKNKRIKEKKKNGIVKS